VRRKANDGPVYAIWTWFKYDTTLPGVVFISLYYVLVYPLQQYGHCGIEYELLNGGFLIAELSGMHKLCFLCCVAVYVCCIRVNRVG